jgi:2,5-furandicarboxylate decarboxylase 1
MNIVEKAERPAADAVDCERFRLRGFVEGLPAEELETRREPVDLADVAAALEDNPRAVLFGAVGPERHQ